MVFKFELLHQSKRSAARVGRIHTENGIIDTPNFVPVATNAAIKAVDSHCVNQHDCQLLFCNTYHLALHPGGEIIEKAGGLHRFMGRKGAIITDSGGFQVFSLAYGSVANELKSKGLKSHANMVLKIDEEGVSFRSYRDGAIFSLTPERSVALQKQLGADIIIPFDELPPFHCDPKALVESLHRTHRWQMRSLKTHLSNTAKQAMYGVVHGGVENELRKQSASYLSNQAFDGFAIGGSLGKNTRDILQVLDASCPYLPREKPRHLLGIADIPSIEQSLSRGIDTFDSCYPTRLARHGVLITGQGRLKITSGKYKQDFDSIDKQCPCWCCQHYSRAYLHHLFKAKEPSAQSLATIHNLQAMATHMQHLRQAILADEI